ncbi:hypothetical protein PDO_0679, partial [Rhizobium sp. PDO1-076]
AGACGRNAARRRPGRGHGPRPDHTAGPPRARRRTRHPAPARLRCQPAPTLDWNPDLTMSNPQTLHLEAQHSEMTSVLMQRMHPTSRVHLKPPCCDDGAFACGWGHPQRLFRNVEPEPAHQPILPKSKVPHRLAPPLSFFPCRAGENSRPCACPSTPPRFSAFRRGRGLSLSFPLHRARHQD